MATITKSTAVITPPVEPVTEDRFVLTLTPREAQVLECILAHTRDIDPDFPEIREIFGALRRVGGVPDYWNNLDLVDDESGERVSVRVKNV